ncbi:LADD protein, partial [Polypterus senegalus]
MVPCIQDGEFRGEAADVISRMTNKGLNLTQQAFKMWKRRAQISEGHLLIMDVSHPAHDLYCVSLGGNLASVHSSGDNHFITSLIRRSDSHNPISWLGGSNSVRTSSWLWTDGSEWDFKNWNPGEPNNGRGIEHCLHTNYDGEPDPDKLIQNGWVSYFSDCYQYFPMQKTWTDAELYCVSLGGNLASLHSSGDNQFITSLIRSSDSSGPTSWLGGSNSVQKSEHNGCNTRLTAGYFHHQHSYSLGGNLASVHSSSDNQFITSLIRSRDSSGPTTWLGGSNSVQLYCVSLGGNLASVHSSSDNQFITSLIRSRDSHNPTSWLGGSNSELVSCSPIHSSLWSWGSVSSKMAEECNPAAVRVPLLTAVLVFCRPHRGSGQMGPIGILQTGIRVNPTMSVALSTAYTPTF